MKPKIKKYLLLALLACDGLPMPETALVTAVQNLCRPDQPARDDVLDALKDIERDGFASGLFEEITGERSWTLTTKGVHKTRQIR